MQGKEKQGKASEGDLWRSVPFAFICSLIATKATGFAKTPPENFPKSSTRATNCTKHRELLGNVVARSQFSGIIAKNS